MGLVAEAWVSGARCCACSTMSPPAGASPTPLPDTARPLCHPLPTPSAPLLAPSTFCFTPRSLHPLPPTFNRRRRQSSTAASPSSSATGLPPPTPPPPTTLLHLALVPRPGTFPAARPTTRLFPSHHRPAAERLVPNGERLEMTVQRTRPGVEAALVRAQGARVGLKGGIG